jgi:hypothetical protein
MPKKKVKRPSSARSRTSSKRSAGSISKAKPSAAKRAKPARSAKASGTGAIDPRVLAAIGLALEDEAQTSARAGQLSQPASPWVALGRVRAVRTN